MNFDKYEKYMQKTIVVWFGAFICCALWGSAFPCIKIGYQFTNISSDATASQVLFAGIRFVLAGIIGIVLGSFLEKKPLVPSKDAIPSIVILCMFQTVLQYVFFYVGLARTTGVKASIIEGVNVFVAVFVSAILFRMEKITLRKIIGCIIGFAGVVLVNLTKGGFDMSFTVLGEGFIFLSTVAYAFSSVCLKRFSKKYNPVMLSGYQFLVGGLLMSLGAVLLGGTIPQINARGICMLLYLAFVSGFAYSLWAVLLKYNPVSKVAVFGFMNPVIGVILSALLLQEGNLLGLKSVVSLVLVCIGIFIVNKKSNAKTDSN